MRNATGAGKNMKRVLVAVDDIGDARAMVSALYTMSSLPEEVILLCVQRLQGKSLITDMLGSAEIAILKEQLEGTDYKEALDKEAGNVLSWYKKEFHDNRFRVRTVIRQGVPSEEILKVAEEEGAELILLGRSSKRGVDRFITGSVSADLKRHATIPVWTGKTSRSMHKKLGALLFLLLLLVPGIYYASVTLIEIGEGLSAGSDMKPLSVSIMVTAMMIAGAFVSLIGGLMGRIIISGNHITIEK